MISDEIAYDLSVAADAISRGETGCPELFAVPETKTSSVLPEMCHKMEQEMEMMLKKAAERQKMLVQSQGIQSNGNINGVNGSADVVNGSANGVNGNANGVNGNANGVNGNADGVNGNANGVNGSVNGVNGSANGVNGNANGVYGNPSAIKAKLNAIKAKAGGNCCHPIFDC